MEIPQFAAMMICCILSFLLMEYYIEYVYRRHNLLPRGFLYFFYMLFLVLGIVQGKFTYIFTTLFLAAFVLFILYRDVQLVFVYVVSLSFSFWIFSGYRTEVLLYNLLTGMGFCLSQSLDVTDRYARILRHLGNLLHIAVVVLCCELLTWDTVSVKVVIQAFVVYISSVLAALGLSAVTRILLAVERRQKYQRYLDPEYELLQFFCREQPQAYHSARKICSLASDVVKELHGNEHIAALLGQYYNIGILSSDTILQSSKKLRKKYRLPKILDSLWEELYEKDNIPTTKETAVVLLAGLTVTTLSYAAAKNRPVPPLEKVVDTIFQNQLQKGRLNASGLSVEELDFMRRAFIRKLSH